LPWLGIHATTALARARDRVDRHRG
jgi:hypothetical protein